LRLTGAVEALAEAAAPAAAALDFEALFSGLEGASGVVAAVSGGPDSTALMQGLARWRQAPNRPPVVVATVDHGLRPDSGAEARAVARAAKAAGLPHHVLFWEGAKPRTRIQERARAERYQRLAALAREVGASHIATGHTLDDQAETVIMRLIAGSGVAGLAAMRAQSVREGVTLARPFLNIRKARLVDLCHTKGWAFLSDPSNNDVAYGRPRLRGKLMPALAEAGLTPERLGTLARRAGQDAYALDTHAEAVLSAVRIGVRRNGGLVLDGARLRLEQDAILLRVIMRTVAATAGGIRRPVRLETVERRVFGDLRPALDQAGAARFNLGGVLVELSPDGRLLVGPEPGRRPRRLTTP
jgi:tRNA(Ile)-lysidine synthase